MENKNAEKMVKVLSCLFVIAISTSVMSVVVAQCAPDHSNELTDDKIDDYNQFYSVTSNSKLTESSSVTIRVKTVAYGDGTVKVLNLESEYLPVVVACENGAAPPEAMKAQAVASRTFAMYRIKHPRGSDFDVWDNESDQVYNPAITVTDQHRKSVSDTNGVVLKYTTKEAGTVIICAFFVRGTGDTVKYVTYNEGKSGDDITQTTLGWCTDPPSKNPYNRGCMGQVQANELASEKGYNYQQILRYFYGADIEGLPVPSFCFPVSSEKYKIWLGFYQRNPSWGNMYHLGEDILLDEGTPIKAIADGRIVWYNYARGYASWDDGNSIVAVIEHDLGQTLTITLTKGDKKTVTIDKIYSIYGHIRKSKEYSGDKLPWKVGDYVKKGDIIGYINDKNHNGDTIEHLHFGIRLGGHYPFKWVYFGYEDLNNYPESNVEYFAAPSEIIPMLDIFAALQYLRTTQNPEDGSWSNSVGITSLATLAFLNAGYDETYPTVNKAIHYILSRRNHDGSFGVYGTYETSTAVLALVATHNPDYTDEINDATKWIVEAQQDETFGYTPDNYQYGGWTYLSGKGDPDLSNTQFALMALDAVGLPKTDPTWSKAIIFIQRCQNRPASNDQSWAHDSTRLSYNDGGFIYRPWGWSLAGGTKSYGSMTAAGIWSLRLCGIDAADERVKAGLNWLTNNEDCSFDDNPGHPYGQPHCFLYYYYLTIAKTLIMCNLQKLGGVDWYTALSTKLVDLQYDDGHWVNVAASHGWEDNPDLATSYAILSLQIREIPTEIKRLSWITVILHSNADLHIYDPLGRHIGKNYTTGGVDLQIPNATYSTNAFQNITIPELETGSYRIVLVGTGTGGYTLNVTGGVGDTVVSEDSYTGNISEGEIHDATVNVAMITWLTIHVEEPNPIDAIVQSATGTGNVSFISDIGIIENLSAVNESDLPAEGKPNLQFSHGFFSFTITGLESGQTVTVTVVFPSNIPTNAQYWKYHTPEGWYQIPMGSNDGDNIITITLQDGGIGDDDCIADGKIIDVGGPGFGVVMVALEDYPDPILRGENLTYKIEIKNEMDIPATHVVIKEYYDPSFVPLRFDPLPTESDNIWSFESIAPGETKEIRITGKVLKEKGRIYNLLLYYSSNGGDGTVVEDTTILCAEPHIQLIAPSQANAGEKILCKLIYYNGGNLDIENITIRFSFPKAKMLYYNTENETEWFEKELKGKSSVERNIYLQINSPLDNGTIIPLFAEFISNEYYLNCTANITVLSSPQLQVDSEDYTDPSYENENITYLINVSNNGNMNAYNATIIFDYDENLLEIIDANGGFDDGDKITWNTDVLAGENIEYEIKAKARSVDEECVAINHISASCEYSNDECIEQTTIKPIFIPSLNITARYEMQVEINCIVVYELNITNNGDGATNATVIFDYDENLLEIIDANGGFDDGDKITWNAFIGAGKNIEYKIKAKVKGSDGAIFCLGAVEWNGNRKSVEIVSNIVNAPPSTELIIHGGYRTKTMWGYTMYYIKSSTYITLNAKDYPNCSSVAHTYYRIWKYEGKWKLLFNWKEYSGEKIRLDEGYKYSIDFYSEDIAGNKEHVNSIDVYVESNGIYGIKNLPGFEIVALSIAMIAAILLAMKRKRAR